MQVNQQVTFLSDGGDTVRDLQLYLNPQGEYLLDWFHIAMRFTVLAQFVKGLLPNSNPKSKEKEKGKQATEDYDEAELNPLSSQP